MQHMSDALRLFASGLLDRCAQLYPFVIMSIPPCVLMGEEWHGLTPTLIEPVVLLGALGVGCAGLITSHLAENAERGLWEKWGGRPGVRMLRHADNQVSTMTKSMWHGSLKSELRYSLPSADTERVDPRYSDEAYSSALTYCEHHFRDRIKFRDLWLKRVRYEFLLNCFAVRRLGFASAIVTPLLSCTRQPVMSLGAHAEPDLTVQLAFDFNSLMAIIICAALAWGWVRFFTAERIRKAALNHDRYMLDCLVVRDDALPSARTTSNSHHSH
jgi:hypothetical protein